MKKKILITLISTIFLMGIISGGILTSIALSNVEYTKEIPTAASIDAITMKCDGVLMAINGSEPDGKYDSNDVRSLMNQNCNGTSTEFTKDSKVWKVNEYGTEGFDEDVLKADACSKESLSFDSKLDQCIEPVNDVGVGDLE